MYSEIDSNKRRTWVLLFFFIAFFLAVGFGFGYVQSGTRESSLGMMGIFGIIAMVYGLISYYGSGSIVLSLAHAKEIQKSEAPDLYRVVENLSIAAGVPMPKVYVIEDSALNAFATGRDPQHASVAITRGLLDRLEKTELEGVMAHELSHVRNYDIRIQSLTVALVGLIALMSDILLRSMTYRGRSSGRSGKGGGILILLGLVLALLSPLIARLIHLAVSRQREYLADASGALLTRYPEGLAKALEKIAADKEPLEVANKATAHMYIENPLRNEKSSLLNGMFNTHPDVNDRISRLRKMGL